MSRNIIIYARKNKLAFNRLGITTGKKAGNAVHRSRARRIIRQAWRENELYAPIGLDLVIVARAGTADIKSTALSDYLRKYGIPALHQIYAGEYVQPQPGGPRKKHGKA